MISRKTSAYGVGDTIHASRVSGGGGPDGCYWTVTHAWFEHANEDMGSYDDLHRAYVLAATEAELAPLLATLAIADARKACEAALAAALSPRAPGVEHVSDTGRIPPDAEREALVVVGRKVSSSGAVTDGGTTYVVTAASIVSHHGGYYDDYRSTTCTIPRSAELAAIVKALAAGDREAIVVLADWAKSTIS
jgi:hypothetical protein